MVKKREKVLLLIVVMQFNGERRQEEKSAFTLQKCQVFMIKSKAFTIDSIYAFTNWPLWVNYHVYIFGD